MARQPHRLILRTPTSVPQLLSFWTAQAVQIARNAAEHERQGDFENARLCWSLARDLSPADAVTRCFCDEHAQEVAV